MERYFRVQQLNMGYQNYDTGLNNYGEGFDSEHYRYFMQIYGDTMAEINLPVDFLISVTSQICLLGEVYLGLLQNAIDDDGFLHLSKVTNNTKYIGYKMPVQLLNNFLQSFDEENQFIIFDNGTILWEYYLEKVRAEEFNHLPARLQSVFFFENVSDCDNYKNHHLSGIGAIFGIETLETTNLFKGDMAIIDELDNSISRDELLEQIRKYWRGDKTENPIMEVVFQGKYNLIEM